MPSLLIELNRDRSRCGMLSLLDDAGRVVCGPCSIAGRASDRLAAANGNPRRSPLLPYGDSPCGTFIVRGLVASGDESVFPAADYGSADLIRLEPLAGDAALAEANGRFDVMIIAGDLAADGRLRSTAGALRLSNADQRSLTSALRRQEGLRCRIVERADLADWGLVVDDAACEQQDPICLPAPVPMIASGAQDQGLMRAGALAIAAVVTFVALEGGSPAQAAETTVAASLAASHGAAPLYRSWGTDPLPQDPSNRYVTLAYGY